MVREGGAVHDFAANSERKSWLPTCVGMTAGAVARRFIRGGLTARPVVNSL
jgi:hypothetical protein